MKAESKAYIPLVKALSFSLKQFRLYSAEHPITKQTLQTLQEEMTKFFAANDKISLGAMRHRLLVNGALVNEKETAANDLAKDFERMGVEGLIVEKKVSLDEMQSFIEVMSTRAKALQDKGGFKKAFEMHGFENIKLSTGKFQLVEDGEVVAREGEEGDSETAEAEKKPEDPSKATLQLDKKVIGSVSEILKKIRDDSKSLMDSDEKVDLDAEKIVQQLEKHPQDFVEAALEEADDADQLELTIRKTVNVLIDGLVGFLVEQGKDITKALDRLCRELEKALGKLGKGGAFDKLREKLPQIFEDRTDELRLQMMVKTYQDNPDDVKLLKKAANKLFKDSAIRSRLSSSVKDELENVGCSREAIEDILVQLNEKDKAKKKRVTIDADELEELRQRAAMADQGIDRQVDKEMQKLQIENRVMRDEKQRVESVIHNLAEGLVVVDKQGKVVLMNPAAEKLLGKKHTEALGQDVGDNVGEEHMLTMTKGNLRDTEDNVASQVEVQSKDEETKRVLQASTAVIENEDGQTVGMVSVLSDVTRQKELSDMKTKFVANVSHELRTPLVAIQKSLGLILNQELGDVSDEQKKFLSIAERNIDRLSRLINDLLDVSKLEAQNLNLKPVKFPMEGLVMHVASTVETWAKDKNVTIKTDLPDDPIEVEADSDRLTQVITNLVGNAVKFTPDGGTVILSAKNHIKDKALGPGEFVEVSVHDSGEGIEPEDQKRIFEKFVQVNVTQQTGVASTGLGLTIAREIVELHSGRIWLESKPQVKGAKFIFRIPVAFKEKEKLPPQS